MLFHQKNFLFFFFLPTAQLEFVQILVIVVVMMVMVVVITCLLNHYRLSARSLLTRHSGAHRRHLPLANVRPAAQVVVLRQCCGTETRTLNISVFQEGGLWSSEGTAPNAGLSEVSLGSSRKCDDERTDRCLT